VPVHEDIKLGRPGRDERIDAYIETITNLAYAGITTVAYNFLPVLDWTRTHLNWELPNGDLALRFDMGAFAAFDMWVLRREGAQRTYGSAELSAAERYMSEADHSEIERLTHTICSGLPGAEESYGTTSLKRALVPYADISSDDLGMNLWYFLSRIIPPSEELGIRMALHPDDPPFSLLGLPRVASTPADYRLIFDRVEGSANGMTFCAGALGSVASGSLSRLAREFGPRVEFAHLRSVRRDQNTRSFTETYHLDTRDVDLPAIMAELLREEADREGGATRG
jgi:mannonate dehydratase